MPKVVVSKVGETQAAGDNRTRLLANPERTGNKYCQVGLLRILPGHKFPMHKHPDSEDVIYIMKGRADFTVGEEKFELGPGELIVIPEHVPHFAVNPTNEDVEMFVFQAPMPKYEFLE